MLLLRIYFVRADQPVNQKDMDVTQQ
ncbi:TPA: hypothetical protein ANIA_11576 [Aspergillus nidulans FGSC A4]|uniref:Uncharacterized protein n=1 Tax=Emericella nidulans (strain FGSC A4 / ATCC 38163 / CBS 112.46 / NRRL 194 / M139) TaxID=227321 RepID=C8VDX7_EMENI|nr:TPA: hypothetical protein ANIA_11576 [Aspergillus nidulans FGSC A4]